MSRGQKRAVIWTWATDCLRRSAVKSRPSVQPLGRGALSSNRDSATKCSGLSNTPACRHEASQKVSKEGYWEAEQI